MNGKGTTRVTVNLPTELVKKLQATSSLNNVTVTDVIRRGLQTEMFLNNEVSQGGKILIKRRGNEIVELLRGY